MRLVRRFLLYGVLAGVVLVSAAAVFVRTSAFRELVRTTLVTRLSPLTGGTLTIERVSGNLFAHVSLEGVSIDGAGGRFIHVERIDAQYFLPSLLRSTLDIRRADIIRPRVSVRTDASGLSTMDGLFKNVRNSKHTS